MNNFQLFKKVFHNLPMSIWQHSYLTEQPSVSIVFLRQAHFSMQPISDCLRSQHRYVLGGFPQGPHLQIGLRSDPGCTYKRDLAG